MKILVVLSDPQATMTLPRLLRDRGDEVWAEGGLENAVPTIKRVRPDLVLFDLHFPGDEWRSVLHRIRREFPHIKIVLTTRHPDLQRELLAGGQSGQIFLQQPFSQAALFEALRQAESPESSMTTRAKPVQPAPPRVRVPVRMKITLPYLVLALLFALASAYIVSQIVVESTQDRFLNQLLKTGRQSADWMVRQEEVMLVSFRLIANAQGFNEAVIDGDAEALRSLTLPLAANSSDEDIEILDKQGVGLLSMRLNPTGGAGDYTYLKGETLFQPLAVVQRVLQVRADPLGDKYAEVVKTPWGNYFYVSGPILDSKGQRVGVLMVGRSLRTITHQLKEVTLGDATIYDLQGLVLASTLFSGNETFIITSSQVEQVMSRQDQASLVRSLNVGSLSYSEILGPWEARGGADLGVMGVAQAQAFLVNTSRTVQVQIFLLVAIAILLVIVIGVFLANRITQPLLRLVEASTQVAQGNLDVKVDSTGNDEIAVLSHSFNVMVRGLQEGSVYRDILGRTVSPQVREQLRQTFQSGELNLEGQQAVATILMTDIRSFTSLVEQVDPATVLAWLNEYFSSLVPIVNAHGGVVNKFDGDAMLCFFGILPRQLSPDQGALAACRAALEILRVVDQINARRIERGDPAMITGIGINTGDVIAGGLGTSDRLHYTILGDAVNTTQRLESLTRQLFTVSGAVIGQATYDVLGAYRLEFKLVDLGPQLVKGKSERINVYRLAPLIEYRPEVIL